MKKPSRMLLFAAVALYLTSLWDKGFIIPSNPIQFLEITLLLALITYLIIPLSKIVLFPIHLLTFGFLSIICYMLLFYLSSKYGNLLQIEPWVFPQFSVGGISIKQVAFSQLGNLLASSVSVSVIINALEKIT